MMQSAWLLHSADGTCITSIWRSPSASTAAQVFEEEETMKDEP